MNDNEAKWDAIMRIITIIAIAALGIAAMYFSNLGG